MIIAETLKRLMSFTPAALTRAINLAGHKGDKFTGARFLGMTNGGQFAYFCTYEVEGGTDSCKVFLTYDPVNGGVTAGY